METVPNVPPGRDHADTSMIKRVVVASGVGSTIEYYDFFLYGIAAALVFPKVFFPEYDPLVGTLLSFSSFAVGFLSRPLGAIVCGHFGDRIGRRRLLIITLLLIGISTAAIGLIPSYKSIGVAAPILLVSIRFIQGFSFGGELGGAAVMAVEHSPKGRRGFWGSLPYAGSPIGQGLATGLTLFISLAVSEQGFLQWGWRIPFVASFLMVMVGLYIRLRITETPVFEAMRRQQKIVTMPLTEVLRRNPLQLLLNTGLHLGITVTFYLTTVFSLSYATTVRGFTEPVVLVALVVACLVWIVIQVFAGMLSDRWGRRAVYRAGALMTAVMAYPFFLLINTGSAPLLGLAIILMGASIYLMYGPQPAYFSEMFAPHFRYTAFALPVALATIIGGSTAPVLAVTLVRRLDGAPWLVAAYWIVIALITAVCATLSPETRDRDLGDADATTGQVAVGTETRGA